MGGGYVGLVSGACLADWGHGVVIADLDATRVAVINAGSSPIHEAGLAELLEANVGGCLRATTDVGEAVEGSDLTLITVGTPSTDDGIDLSAVISATRAVGEAVRGKKESHAVVVKSTVVPGTTDGVVTETLEEASGRRTGPDLGVGMNPEFLTEGRAVADFLQPDRIVLGAHDQRMHDLLCRLYEPVDSAVPRLLTNPTTAEMIKYASNALLATSISFTNELADLCAEIGDVDIVDVMRGVHASDYLSPVGAEGTRLVAPISSFLEAGCGFGGSCLPKDLRALIAEGRRHGRGMPLLSGALETNDGRPGEMVRLLQSELGELRGRRVTILGIAFKPNTDDTRESPAIPITTRLIEQGVAVTLHDPVVTEMPAPLEARNVQLEQDLPRALENADAVVLVTAWDHYRAVPSLLSGRHPQPVVLDGRRLLEAGSVARYLGIGRGR